MDGIRDSKEINGVKHDYVTQGGNVALDTWTDKSGKHRMEFVYDNSGSPYSVILDGKTYYYVLNHLGDVVRIVDESGNTVTEYVYNSWGEILNNISVNKTMIGRLNPFRYRSYYYDIETGMYYLQNRYYDSVSHRFINMDTSISNAGKYIAGYNLFAYCINNPVNMSDHSGEWPKWIQKGIRVARNIAKNIAKKLPKISPQKSHHNKNKGSKKRIHQKKASKVRPKRSSHDKNRRPYIGKPGSTYVAPNGDRRTYGNDGKPKRDYDHSDHGNPSNHPHDEKGGHYHDWDGSKRGSAYVFKGTDTADAITVLCTIGIVCVVADDVLGVGVADDFCLIPLGAAAESSTIFIFG